MARNIKKYLYEKDNDYSELENKFFEKYKKSLIFDHCELDKDIPQEEMLTASVVIPAWNAEDTILACLTALEKSSFNEKYPGKMEVIVSNDGSTDKTEEIIRNCKLNLNLTMVYQQNHSQGPAMNAGISAAKNDIIIECDADTLLNYYAIENLMVRHQFYKNALYTGFRYYIDDTDKRVSLDYVQKNGPDAKFYITNDERTKFYEPGWPNNMLTTSAHYKKLGHRRGLWMPTDDNDDPWLLADMVFGMLFSMPRDIFQKIGGFDDRFKGWGCDDGYVGAKAISEGVLVIPVYTATGFHISHPFRTSDKETEYAFNRKFFFDFINSEDYEGHPNWIAKAAKRIERRIVLNNRDNKILNSKKSIIPFDVDDFIALGKYQEAYDLIQKEKTKDTLQLSKILNGLEKYDECIELLEGKKTNSDILFQLVMSYAGKGEFKKAYEVLTEIANTDPDYPELVYWLHRDPQANMRQGIKYYNEENFFTAKKCFEAVLIRDNENEEALEYWKNCKSKNT